MTGQLSPHLTAILGGPMGTSAPTVADGPGKIGNANTRSHPKGWLPAFLCEEGGRKIVLFLYIQTRCVDANRRKEQANTTKRGPK